MFMREAEMRYQRNEAEQAAARARHLASQLQSLEQIKSEIDVTACREAHIEHFAKHHGFTLFWEGPCVAKIPFAFERKHTLTWGHSKHSDTEEPGTLEKEFAKQNPHFAFVQNGKGQFYLSLKASHFQ